MLCRKMEWFNDREVDERIGNWIKRYRKGDFKGREDGSEMVRNRICSRNYIRVVVWKEIDEKK